MTDSARTTIFDGNAIAGAMAEFFGEDPTTLRLRCGHCDGRSLLAEAIVEMDDAAAIVRCRNCTRTLLTLLQHPASTEIVIAALAGMQRELIPRQEEEELE